MEDLTTHFNISIILNLKVVIKSENLEKVL